MTKKKTSAVALAFAAVGLAGTLSAIWYANNSDILTDVEGATRTIASAGYTPVSVGGYSALGCGKGDIWATKFTAKNTQGGMLSGAVCKTLFGRQRITFE